MKYKILAALLFAGAVIFSCCNTPIGPDDQFVFPNPDSTDISYFNHVQPFLRTKCSMSGCHGETDSRRMTTYFQLTDDFENPGLIVKGEPEYSVLVQMMDGRLPHVPPFREDYFTDNQIKAIRSWIEDGAPNN